MKKAQVTIFIIMGIILFAAAAILFSLPKQKIQSSKISSNPVENYIEECIEKTTAYGLYVIGLNGGRIVNPDDSFEKGLLKVSYILPSLEEVKLDLESYIDQNLNKGTYSCINNLSIFKNQYREISVGQVKSEVLFTESTTIIKVNMTTKLKSRDKTQNYNSFNKDVKVRFKKILELLHEKRSSNELPTNNLLKQGVYLYSMFYTSDNTELIIAQDEKSKIYNNPFTFMTANKNIEVMNFCS